MDKPSKNHKTVVLEQYNTKTKKVERFNTLEISQTTEVEKTIPEAERLLNLQKGLPIVKIWRIKAGQDYKINESTGQIVIELKEKPATNSKKNKKV